MNKLKIFTLLQRSYLFSIFGIIYAPILVLMVYSFNNTKYSLIWHGFTLSWYKTLWQDDALWEAVWHSVVLGISASMIATVLATFAAINLYRYVFIGKKVLYFIIFTLIIVPDILLGVCLLLFYSMVRLPLGFSSLLIAHVTLCLPFATMMIYSRLANFDHNIFEAAKDLGANELQTFVRIVLPIIASSILSAWLLSFTLSFDDVIISYFVSGPGFGILPLQIYAMVKLGMKPEINALCTITFAITVLITLCALKLSKKSA